jgi:hypothetical protein
VDLSLRCPVQWGTRQPLFIVRCAHNLFKKTFTHLSPRPGSFHSHRSAAQLLSLSRALPHRHHLVTAGDHRGLVSSELHLPVLGSFPSHSSLVSLYPYLSLYVLLSQFCPNLSFILQILRNYVKILCPNVSLEHLCITFAGNLLPLGGFTY